MRAVLFDFYGTLATATSSGRSRRETLAAYGYVVADEQLYTVAPDPGDGEEHLEHSGSREEYVAWERARLVRVARLCGVGDDDLERLVDDLHGSAKAFTMRAYPEAAPVLERLRARGVKIAICSNWDWDLDRAVAQAGLSKLVDVEVTSARAGARKPHPRIYQHALALVGSSPGETLFVGDSWGPDVEGPLRMGMQVVHLWRSEERGGLEPPALREGVARVGDLWGVLDVLGAG